MTPHEKLTALLSEHGLQIPALKPLRKQGKLTSYYFMLRGADAVAMWQSLRDLVDISGYWPVIIGTSSDLDQLNEVFARQDAPDDVSGEGFVARSPASIYSLSNLSAAAGLAWLEREHQVRYSNEHPLPRGDWPDDIAEDEVVQLDNYSYSSLFDFRTEQIYVEVNMALVPCTESWLVPVLLAFGDWNDCPTPDVHAAVLKYWHDTYGAEVVALTHDSIDLHISTPPTSKQVAVKVAEEQFVYCSEKDYGLTVEEIAAQLINAPAWCFWWD